MQSFLASAYGSWLLSAAASTCRINGQPVSCEFLWEKFWPFFSIFIPIALILGLIVLVSMWKIFEKAGQPGWAAIVPVYNMVVLFQIIGLNPWLVLLIFIPFVNSIAGLVFKIITVYRFALAFNKGTGFAVGLFFLPFIFYPMIAFGPDQFDGSRLFPGAPVAPSGSNPPTSVPPTSTM